MYFIPDPKMFHPAEFFPKSSAIHFHNPQIWRLMDDRILWTAVELRKRFGVMHINSWLWGGSSQYRSFRPILELLDKKRYCLLNDSKALIGTFTSQHCFGRAIDASFRDYTAEEIREDVKKHPKEKVYQFITCIENNVSWFHFDCRSWDKDKYGILYVNP
jgi:hypothetical protein